MTTSFLSDTTAQVAQRELDDARARHHLGLALDHAHAVGGAAGVSLLSDYRRRIAAVEATILAERVHGDGNTRDAERLLADGKTSKREQRRKAKRAKAVAKNKALADKMANGEMSEEQVDVIADAAAKSDGDAAVGGDLIDKVASMPPEQGQRVADDYLADRATADDVQTEHDRQRALRAASRYDSKAKGLAAISIEGDNVAVDAMWKAIQARADSLYKQDGGRDLSLNKHPSTARQRLFDAAYDLITGTGTGTGSKAKASQSKSGGVNIVIGLTIDKLVGRDPDAVATQYGLGLIADSVLADYANHANIFAALYDRTGLPLWLGRLRRRATATQRIALILRDRGCTLCGADHTICQVHHTLPWHAPGKGRTDLDNLVLLCGSCHHQLHANNHTIYQDTSRTWRTRPATPDETPPQQHHNQPQRE